jgi:hypothetical protein
LVSAQTAAQSQISPAAGFFLAISSGTVLFLAVNPRPHLVQLQTFALKIPKHFALVFGADHSDFKEQPHYGLFRNAGHAHSGANRATFNQASDHLFAGL